jgi:tetratricopeptide (TPR) repeat protein
MLEEAKKLCTTYPRSALAQRVLGDAYYYLNMMDDSMTAIKRAIDLDPANARGWNDLAILYRRSKDSVKAQQVYTHALKLAPDDAKLLIEYADSIAKSNPGAARGALSHARTLLFEKRGVDAESLVYPLGAQLVWALSDVGDLHQAYEASLEVVQVHPEVATNWEAKAVAALNTKRFSEVRPAIDRANQLDSKNVAWRYIIAGNAALEGGDVASAIDAFQRAHNIRSDDPRALTGLISAFCKKNPLTLTEQDGEYIGRCLNELKKIDPKLGESWGEWALQLLKRKSTESAKVTTMQSVSIALPQGDTVLPAGTELEFISRDGSEVRVRYKGQEYWIPISATDLR